MSTEVPSVVTTDDLSITLSALVSRVDAWRQQRSSIIKELERLAALTASLLQELGTEQPREPSKGSRGGRPKGYKASAATRAKLRAAWKRRKDATQAPKRRLSPEGRRRIAAAQRKRWAEAKRG